MKSISVHKPQPPRVISFKAPKTCLTSHKAIDTKRAKEKIPYPCKDVFIHMLFFCYIYISNVDVYILRLWLRHCRRGSGSARNDRSIPVFKNTNFIAYLRIRIIHGADRCFHDFLIIHSYVNLSLPV